MSINETTPASSMLSAPAKAADSSVPPSSFLLQPSLLRAWWSLVCLSFWRQAKARQMVWIALGLMVFAVALVAAKTRAGTWGMDQWRHPFKAGPTYLALAYDGLTVTAAVPKLEGHGFSFAVFSAFEAIISPTIRDTQGRLLAASEFLVFSQYVVFSVFLTFLLPVWSLSFATEALGGERESQSLIWLLSRPLPRPAIYLAKFVALLPWSVGLNVVGFSLLCLAAGPPGRMALRLYWPAVVSATLAFSALFLLLGAYFRRPAVVAIVYSFCLEVVLGNMPGYLKRVSIGFYTRCMMFESAGAYGVQPDKPNVFLPVTGVTALLVLAGGTAVLLGVGMWVFSQSQYHELD